MPSSDPTTALRLRDHRTLYYNPGRWDWVSPSRNHYNLWIGLSGRGTMEIDGRRHPVGPGTGALLTPRTAVRAANESGFDVHNIGVHFTVPARCAAALDRRARGVTEVRCLPLLNELARHIEEFGASPDAREDELNALARLMVRVFLREQDAPREDPLARRLKAQATAIRMQPGASWDVATLAREASVSVSQYNRRFRQVLHLPPNAFIIDCRIEKARQLLRESTLGVDEIARTLGYHSAAFFSRQFKSKTGTPPLHHRRRKDPCRMSQG